MFDFIEAIRGTLDAPWGIILTCPVATICAMHFFSGSKESVRGAHNNVSAIKALLAAKSHRNWAREVGFYLSLLLAASSFAYLWNPVDTRLFIQALMR